MDYFASTHERFLAEMTNAVRLDSRPISFVPSAIFFIGAFALTYRIFHRRTTRLTRTKTWLYRQLGFHWTFFYLARIWFLVIRCFRHVFAELDEYARASNMDDNFILNSTFVGGTLLLTLFSFGSIPLLVFTVKVWMQERVPNFLLWAGEDPWLRSEIGMAGHYLDRPPSFPCPKRKEYAYRSRRSTSAEENLWKGKGMVARNCWSMQELRCVKSIQELLD